MKWIITTIISSFLVGMSWAQVAQYPDIYPTLPFSLAKATELGYIRTTVWIDHYAKGEDDESGYIWSNMVGDSYQYERYQYFEGQLSEVTRYRPDGYKLMMHEYFYKKTPLINFDTATQTKDTLKVNLLSAIDKVVYDSLENEQIDYSYVYFYKANGVPFQKVKQFPTYRSLRVLYDFTFDENNRVVREKIKATGNVPKMDSLIGMEPNEKTLILTGYDGDTKTVTTYQNMYKTTKTEKTIYHPDGGYPMKTEITDGDDKTVMIIDYDYEGEKLVKENHILPSEGEIIQLKTIYYQYDDNDMIETKIIEKGDQQTVFSYTYSGE